MNSHGKKKEGGTDSAKKDFSATDFERALHQLDTEIKKSKNLRRVSPVRIVAVGGYVAVKYLQNRQSTKDIDYFLDPALEPQFKLEEKLKVAISTVAEDLDYDKKWCNDNVKVYALGDRRQTLFKESLDQNVELWRGTNLIIYAAKWEWVLDRKLKRLARDERQQDYMDCVAILHILIQQNGGPLSRESIKLFNFNPYDQIQDSFIDKVALRYQGLYRTSGITG